MQKHTDKNQENQSRSASVQARNVQQQNTSTFQFVDNRLEAIQMRKLQEMANSYTRKNSLQFVDNRPEAIAQRQLQEMANSNFLSQHVIQRHCTHCGNSLCDDRSICDYDGRSYSIGDHGARRSEQRRLTDQFGQVVSGDTHQSEHYYGFAVLNQTSGQSRREAGRFEREAPAYQEVHDSHRAHVGTGSSSTIGPSGFSADTYREYQRALLESGNPSASGQLNSLGYAFVPGFQGQQQTVEGQQAHNSFEAMLGGMQEVTYMQGSTPVQVPISNEDRLEQLAARFTAENERYPTVQEISEMRTRLGM